MKRATEIRFRTRKTPRQTRSAASVNAILEATLQVLLTVGKQKLTTTRVAQRAGVSVGTLYQYFPNKSALLQALLKQHLDSVADAIEIACASLDGAPLETIAEGITSAFLEAKFQDIQVSAALYAISDDVEGNRIARNMHGRSIAAMATVFASALPESVAEPAVTATMILGAMAGVSRSHLENGATYGTRVVIEQELTRMVRAYLESSSV